MVQLKASGGGILHSDFVITGIECVILVGKEEYPEERTSFSTEVVSNELIFHFSGDAINYFDDQIFELKPGTVRFLPQSRVSRYDVVRRERGECIDVFFTADRPVADRAFVLDASDRENLSRMFKRIFATWVGKEEGYYFECLSILYGIFAELQKKNYTPLSHDARIRPAVQKIQGEFLSKDLYAEELAQSCGMGVSYFNRLFREKYGVSPRQYVIQMKMNHACELLSLGRYTVTQVAELCRFKDVYFFSRQFKAHMGITPTQYIKKYRSSK